MEVPDSRCFSLLVDSSVKRKSSLLHHSLSSISSPCLFFLLLPALDYLRDERITAGPVRSLSLIAVLEEDLVAPSALVPGRDEPLLPREAGSAVAGRQVAAACEKRDLQEVPVPARFLLRRAIPPVLTAGLCAHRRCGAPLVFASLCIVAVWPLVKATWRGSLNP